MTSLRRPLKLRLFDGSSTSAGLIQSFTKLKIRFPDGTEHSVRFLVTRLHPAAQLVLGLDWLRTSNPHIDWSEGTLSFGGEEIHSEPGLDKDANLRASYEYPVDSAIPQAYSPPEPSISLIGAAAFNACLRDDARFGIFWHSPNSDSASAFSADVNPDDEDAVEIEEILKRIPEEYRDFADVFSKRKADELPEHRPYDHKIEIPPDASVPFGPVYHLSEPELKICKDYIEEHLRKGFIRPSHSSAGAPILFAKKKDGSLRFCVDYRGLNKLTRKSRYPIPLIANLLDHLQHAKIYTKLDLRAGYNQIRIAAGDEWKTAFRTRYGQFEYLVLPFGLCNAPATFQRYMNESLQDYIDIFVAVYLDDILVYSVNKEEHVIQVRTVLQRMRDRKLYANIDKCEFHTTSTSWLGFVITPEGVTMETGKVSAILGWPNPKSVKDIQSFLGFANFYRRFIAEYSKIATPLTRLTRKDVKFEWGEDSNKAFNALKHAFTTAPILSHFDPSHETIVETDASDYAIAAILSQTHPDTGILHPVAFHSRTMNSAELNYEIYDKELLAIVEAFKHWRAYLEGPDDTVSVVTDHKNLEYFNSTKVLTRRQARWSEYLSRFDFNIKYRPGRLGGKPDALTRRDDVYSKRGDTGYADANPQNVARLFSDGQLLDLPERGNPAANSEVVVCFSAINSAALKALGVVDMDSIAADIKEGIVSDPEANKLLDAENSKVTKTKSGLLLVKGRVYVPDFKDLRLRILQLKHDHPISGHWGFIKTYEQLRRDYYFPHMRKFIKEYCDTCAICPLAKTPRHKPWGLLKQLEVPTYPWQGITMDLITDLPESDSFDTILVIVDRLTKMALFIPTTKSVTAEQFADLFILHVFAKHGLPENMTSDRGTQWRNEFFDSLSKLLRVQVRLSTAHHPQTDGQTERVNQILEQYLRIYCSYQQDDWSKLLPLAEFSYNNASHSGTGVSPFSANKGFNPRDGLDLSQQVSDLSARTKVENMDEMFNFLREHLKVTQAQYLPSANAKRQDNFRSGENIFKVGDLVHLSTKNITTERPTKKLDWKQAGPFEIISEISSHAFRLKLSPKMRIHPVFHVALLEPTKKNQIPHRAIPPPPPIVVEGEEEHEVAAVVDSRLKYRRIYYRVRWLGWEGTPEEYSWEPLINLGNAQDKVAEFHHKYPNKPSAE